MGRKSDPLAVVDPKARVIGVKNLRVVDASSFALLPPGHPQSTVCEFSLTRIWLGFADANEGIDALAEKIAAEILKRL